MKKRRLLALLTVLVLMAGACGGGRNEEEAGGAGGEAAYPDPGITDEEVLVGMSLPFSGPASQFGTLARSTEAYFRYVNEEKGGVKMRDGKTRKLRAIPLDDGFTPSRTVENAKRLVEQDKVFLLHQVLGTAPNTAVWDYLEQQKVPSLFAQTGASKWGADLADHKHTIGGLLAYSTESLFYVDWLKENMPNAKVAIIYQNDDFGKDYYNALTNGFKGTNIKLVAEQTYALTDADLNSQMTNLSQSDADVFFLIATGKWPLQAIKKKGELGWKPLTMMHSPLANIETVFKPAGPGPSTGIMAVKTFKEPGDPAYANDPAMQEYREKVVKYGKDIQVLDPTNSTSWLLTDALVKVLEQSEPNRASVLETVRSLDKLELGLLRPGVTFSTSEKDGFLIESGQLVKFNGTGFDPVGEPRSFEGETPIEGVPGVE